MKKPKILILIMSASNDFFRAQMSDVKETWIDLLYKENTKSIIDNYCDDIDWLYYDNDDSRMFSITEQNDLKLIDNYIGVIKDEQDSHHLITTYYADKFTWHKTYLVFKYLFKENQNIYNKYDYVIRTNTSTYLNLPLLSYVLYRDFNKETINNVENYKITYGADLISSIFESVPKEFDLYTRGNCMILSRYNIQNVILKYGQIFNGNIIKDETIEISDDIRIGNLLNSYYNDFDEDSFKYLKYYKGLPFNWYRSAMYGFNNHHKTSSEGMASSFKLEDKPFYELNIAIQVKSYEFRSTESDNYHELHNKMKTRVYPDYSEEYLENLYNKIEKYSENPSVFLLGNINYMPLTYLKQFILDTEARKVFKSFILQNCPTDVFLYHKLADFLDQNLKN